MTMVLLPITLTTASLLAILCLVLAIRVVNVRASQKIINGDGGNTDLILRMRTQANFVEYVPLLLILMGLLELGGANRIALAVFGGALVIARVFHAIGMPRPTANFFRGSGALVTFLLLIVGAAYGLWITWVSWSPTLSG